MKMIVSYCEYTPSTSNMIFLFFLYIINNTYF